MKPNKLVRPWPPEGWTIVRVEYPIKYGFGNTESQWHGLNTKTGVKTEERGSYEGALALIPDSNNAEPWGV